ncbi:MAG: RnfABCDGE type electron transport complex subunit D [Treponema sp.]|nr:RnfABCDGE type electron transport complex subunit D [Treponema sp.]
MPYKTPALFESPQISIVYSYNMRMWFVCVYAFVAILVSAIGDSGLSLYVSLTALAAALLTEFLIGLKTGRHTVFDGSAAASALILSLMLPNQISPVFTALSVVFAIVIVKMNFGGLGANWLNPAVSGWLFLRFSWPGVFDDAISGSPLSFLVTKIANGDGHKIGSIWEILTQNGFARTLNTITSSLNSAIFSFFKVELPSGYLDFFASPGTGIIGDRGVYALFLGSIFIVALGISRFFVSALYLAVYLLLIKVAGALPTGGGICEGDIIFGLFSGGTLITAFLLLTDPVTSPKSGYGKTFVAVAAAVFSFFFRYMKNEPYGAFFAVALLNITVPLIRCMEIRGIYEHKKQRNTDISGRMKSEGNDEN